MWRQSVALAVAALVVSGTAHAVGTPIQSDPIVAKVDGPVFLGPTSACPAGRVHTRLVSEAGRVIGSSMLCLSSAVFDEASATFTQAGALTLHLPGGTIVADATIADDFSGYPVVQQSISGTVVGGTGLYRGATGSLSGGGTILFDESGVPHPDSTLVVDLD
jgi:hypothetical protein